MGKKEKIEEREKATLYDLLKCHHNECKHESGTLFAFPISLPIGIGDIILCRNCLQSKLDEYNEVQLIAGICPQCHEKGSFHVFHNPLPSKLGWIQCESCGYETKEVVDMREKL